MKLRKLLVGLLVVSAMFLLVACDCQHVWNDGEVTVEATETTEGVKTFTCTECGETKEESIPALPHTHTYNDDWSVDESEHWHYASCGHDESKDRAAHTWDGGVVTTVATCVAEGVKTTTCTVCGYFVTESIAKDAANHVADEEVIVTYENGYKVSTHAQCGAEAKVAHLTYDHTYAKDGAVVTDKLGATLNEDGTWSFEFTTPQWGRIVMYYDGQTISSADSTMLNGKGWNGGAYAGTYPLYHDGDTITFLSATGGTYPVVYNTETKELLLGVAVLPMPATAVNLEAYNKDAASAVWNQEGFVMKTMAGAYSTPNGWRLYIVVDKDGRIAYMGQNMVNGYGGAMETSYIRHSAYANYKDNPAFLELSDEYEGKWGTTVDWSLGVPEGGFIITAHSGYKSALVEMITGIAEADQTDGKVNSNANNVDNVRIYYNAEQDWIVVEKSVTALAANSDAELAVWNQEGFVMKTAAGAYSTPNGWRLYIVVDKDGRIAYMGQNMVNGYGGAMETSYIRHSAYANYKDNPAFLELSDEYEGKWGTTVDWSLGVPEGGFIITGHSGLKTALVQMITGLAEAGQTDAAVNSNAINVDRIRLSYDAATGQILLTYAAE